MGVKKCEVTFSRRNAVYNCGETVQGAVSFVFDAPKRVKDMVIEIKGEAHTGWDVTQYISIDAKYESHLVHYTGFEEYINKRTILDNNEANKTDDGSYLLDEGTYTYNFACSLPNSLPCSFEGPFGYVRYKLKIVLVRPWTTDQEYNFDFKVVSIFDLNLHEKLKTPQTEEITKRFCCLFCKSGPVVLNVTIPCSGFTPGQKLPIAIDCVNGSSVKVENITIKLGRVETYFVNDPGPETKKNITNIACVVTRAISPHCNAEFEEVLQIPEDCTTSNIECSLIQIDYLLGVRMKVGKYYKSPKKFMDISIGHIPIREKVDKLGEGVWKDKQAIIGSSVSMSMTPATPVLGGGGVNAPTDNMPVPPLTNPVPPEPIMFPPVQLDYPPRRNSLPTAETLVKSSPAPLPVRTDPLHSVELNTAIPADPVHSMTLSTAIPADPIYSVAVTKPPKPANINFADSTVVNSIPKDITNPNVSAPADPTLGFKDAVAKNHPPVSMGLQGSTLEPPLDSLPLSVANPPEIPDPVDGLKDSTKLKGSTLEPPPDTLPFSIPNLAEIPDPTLGFKDAIASNPLEPIHDYLGFTNPNPPEIPDPTAEFKDSIPTKPPPVSIEQNEPTVEPPPDLLSNANPSEIPDSIIGSRNSSDSNPSTSTTPPQPKHPKDNPLTTEYSENSSSSP